MKLNIFNVNRYVVMVMFLYVYVNNLYLLLNIYWFFVGRVWFCC